MKKTYKAKYKNLPEIIIEAESTSVAGDAAAKTYAKLGHSLIDPFTIDIIEVKENHNPFNDEFVSHRQTIHKKTPLGAIPKEPITDDEITEPIPLLGSEWLPE